MVEHVPIWLSDLFKVTPIWLGQWGQSGLWTGGTIFALWVFQGPWRVPNPMVPGGFSGCVLPFGGNWDFPFSGGHIVRVSRVTCGFTRGGNLCGRE